MKALTHWLWIALASCGGSDHVTGSAAGGTEVNIMTLQKTTADDVCPVDGEAPKTLPDGSIAPCVESPPITAPFTATGAGRG